MVWLTESSAAFYASFIYTVVILVRQRDLKREVLPAYDAEAPPLYAEHDPTPIEMQKRRFSKRWRSEAV